MATHERSARYVWRFIPLIAVGALLPLDAPLLAAYLTVLGLALTYAGVLHR